jgi:hypothetical protein
VQYIRVPDGSKTTPQTSDLYSPVVGWAGPVKRRNGETPRSGVISPISMFQASPASCSSHDSQVPHGVGPPAQFALVPPRMRYARAMEPSGRKRIADVPAPVGASDSEFVTRTQPPSAVG